jgi:transcription elongation factor GreA
LEGARVIECRRRGGAAEMGAHVRIRDRDARTAEEYDIVGSGEGDPEAGRISHDSPIGGALLGHHEGDVVESETPGGVRQLKILLVQ